MSWSSLPGLGAYEPWFVAVLLGAGLVAGFVNTVAGGGSLLTLPALMLLGLPATLANGTNRLCIVAQSLAGTAAYHRAGKLHTPALARVLPPTLLGSALGAYAASRAPETLLRPVLLATLVVVALLLTFRPRAVVAEGEEPRAIDARAFAGLFAAGMYGGFIQAGVGFVLLSVLGGMLRYDLLRANALKLVCTTIFGSVALVVFVLAAQVVWLPAALLAAATVLGSVLGVRFAVKLDPVVLRRLVLVVVVACVIGVLLKG